MAEWKGLNEFKSPWVGAAQRMLQPFFARPLLMTSVPLSFMRHARGDYRLEQFFRSKKIDAKYKAARYQILLIACLLMDDQPLPWMNSKEIAKRCEPMMKTLQDDSLSESLFSKTVPKIEKLAGPSWTRDTIRTEPITKAIFQEFGLKYKGG
jgi:hypothetical protein